jgi:hypothetical protein
VADLLGHLGSAAAAAGVSPGPQAAHDGRDDVDIEADNLLHSMGLPPIMEMPTPSDDAFSPAAAHAAADRGHYAHNGVGSRSLGRQRYASPAGGNSSSRYQELLRMQSKAWRSSPGTPRSASGTLDAAHSGSFGGFPIVSGTSGSEAAAAGVAKGSSSAFAAAAAGPEPSADPAVVGKRPSLSEGGGSLRSSLAGASSSSSRASISLGGAVSAAAAGGISNANSGSLRRGDRSASTGLGPADLAAKFGALEADWKGYKKQSAAPGNQHPHRRSIPGGSKQGRPSYSSLPGSPAGGNMPGGSFGLSNSRPGSASKDVSAAAGGRRQSLSACNTPHQGLHQQGGGFWPHQQGPDYEEAAGHEDTGVAAVAKELNFLDIEPEPCISPPLGGSTPEPQLAGSGESSSSSRQGSASRVGSANRPGVSPHAGSGPGRSSRPNSQPSTPTSAGSNSNSRRRRPRRQQQQQDGGSSSAELQQLPGSGGGGGSGSRSSRVRGGQWVARSVDGALLQQQQQQQRRRREGVQVLLEDEVAEDDSADDDNDNEDNDPSYDPAVHGTPAAAGRGAGRRSGRHGGRNSQRHSRLSAGSSDTGGELQQSPATVFGWGLSQTSKACCWHKQAGNAVVYPVCLQLVLCFGCAAVCCDLDSAAAHMWANY